MKLAFCLFKYFPFGGLQRDFLRIARECYARGHDIHVYTMQWQGDSEPGWQVHIVKVHAWQNQTCGQAFAQAVRGLLQQGQYDAVIGFNKMPYLDLYYAADACYQARLQKQHAWQRYLPRHKRWIALEQAVFAHGQAAEIMLIAPAQQAEFMRYYATEAKRFHLLPPGISPDRAAPPDAHLLRDKIRAAYHIAADQYFLLMLASSFKTKGLDRVLRGFAALPDTIKTRCHLFVLGQDEPSTYLALAQKLQIDITHLHFLGGRTDVLDFLLAADLLVHPAYHENAGIVLLEAMAAGLAVLTLDVCGYAPYISNAQAGWVLPSPFQQDAWNTALRKAITAPERVLYGQQGLAFARTHNIYSLPQKAADLIEQTARTLSGRAKPATFNQFMTLQGEVFRQQKGRLTQRVKLDNHYYFIKQYTGIGWREIFKNLLQLRWPVISAKHEWQAIEKLQTLGVAVPTVIHRGAQGLNPATRQSFVLMQEIAPAISLETLCQSWLATPPTFNYKQALLTKVAHIARLLHTHGINHRDFYICHFLLIPHEIPQKLYLIDLHRAQIRRTVPARWIIKDLAGLYFSSKDIGLTHRDYYRFMQLYRGKKLRDILSDETNFWKKVTARGERLYRSHS